jgi:hypothetical protein
MIEKDDWRIRCQANYLTGIKLKYGPYRLKSREWDHDHCEFCWAKFIDRNDWQTGGYEIPKDYLTEGYHSEDQHWWICPRCFEDFREMFGWIVEHP